MFFTFQILCTNGYVSTLKLLIEEGDADIHERSPATFWVPLHEVALRGHLDCVKLLLSHNAAIHPRTVDGDTPKDLALRSGKDNIVEYFGEYLKMFLSQLDLFVANAPFLYPQKTSENRRVFWCFQWLEKGCIRSKWVNISERVLRQIKGY